MGVESLEAPEESPARPSTFEAATAAAMSCTMVGLRARAKRVWKGLLVLVLGGLR